MQLENVSLRKGITCRRKSGHDWTLIDWCPDWTVGKLMVWLGILMDFRSALSNRRVFPLQTLLLLFLDCIRENRYL